MSSIVTGIVLEGLSTTGKTSVLKAIKQVQAQDSESERSVVILGEHYSQQLKIVHGKEVSLTVSAHAELLTERVNGIETLNSWAVNLGPHRRASRGLFFLFERFHLNHRISYPDSPYIDNIEERLNKLNCSCILLTVSADKVKYRLGHRSKGALTGAGLDKAASEWLMHQERLMKHAEISTVPYTVINTDGMVWKEYAKSIMQIR